MASTTTKAATAKSSLAPSMTLKGHTYLIESISYFPDGQRMVSGAIDKTVRQWDLKEGKEIEEVRDVCEEWIWARIVAVSRDSRWVVTTGGHFDRAELKVCEVETGIVKNLHGHSNTITCIDISGDNTLLASGSGDTTARIWNLETGKLVAGPFGSDHDRWVGAVRFSTDSKMLAVELLRGKCLEVWDIQSQKLVKRIGNQSVLEGGSPVPFPPIFWTNKNKNILATFSFSLTEVHGAKTIYEFDASTLETVGTPFEGHTDVVTSLALSFDGILLASASYNDNTIKLWAFGSRQLLASYDVYYPRALILSPDSRKLAYTTYTDSKVWPCICICDTPPDVLAQAQTRTIAPIKRVRALSNPLNVRVWSFTHYTIHPSLSLQPDGTRRLVAGCRKRPIYVPPAVHPPPTTIPQQPSFRLTKLLRFSRTTGPAHPVRNDQPRHPLDVPATLPLPPSRSSQAATQFDHFEIGSPSPRSIRVAQSLRQHLSFFAPKHSLTPPVVEVAPGRKFTRLAAVKLPEYKKVDDTRHSSSQQATIPQENDTSDIDSLPDVHWCNAFLCYCSCWSHGRLRMPPRWRLERVDMPPQDGTTDGSRNGVHGRS